MRKKEAADFTSSSALGSKTEIGGEVIVTKNS